MHIKRIKPDIILSGIHLGLFLIMLLSMSGCEFIGGIFKTGVGVGAFIVVVLVLLILAFVMMARRR
jgi:hypothetical protein